MTDQPRPKLVIFSPLPPARNGIADYSARLLAALTRSYDCICVVADDAPDPEEVPAQVLYAAEYRRLAAELAMERHLFQVGNNSGSAYMLPWLEKVSGVVAVHDPGLAHLMSWLSRAGLESTGFRDLTAAAEGPAGLAYLDACLEARAAIGQELTYLAPVVSAAREVIVHSELAKLRVLASTPNALVNVIPHFVEIQPDLEPRPAHAGRPVSVLCLGFVTYSKRIDLVLRALAILRHSGLEAHLTIAGELRPEDYDVEAEIHALDLEDAVTLTGYVEEAEIGALLRDADIVVNLRDLATGESSGSLMRAMGAGRCCVVTDIGAFAELPDEAVVKVDLSEMTADGLARCLLKPVADEAYRARIAEYGRDFVRKTAALNVIGRGYGKVIETAYEVQAVHPISTGSHVSFLVRQDADHVLRQAALLGDTNDVHPLWWRERLLPVTRGAGRLLAIGSRDVAQTSLAMTAFGWKSVIACHPSMRDLRALADERADQFDAALVLIDDERDARASILEELLCSGLLTKDTVVTIDVANVKGQGDSTIASLDSAGLTLVRAATKIMTVDFHAPAARWMPADMWCGTFVRTAARPVYRTTQR